MAKVVECNISRSLIDRAVSVILSPARDSVCANSTVKNFQDSKGLAGPFFAPQGVEAGPYNSLR
jgi:hypothetical protein